MAACYTRMLLYSAQDLNLDEAPISDPRGLDVLQLSLRRGVQADTCWLWSDCAGMLYSLQLVQDAGSSCHRNISLSLTFLSISEFNCSYCDLMEPIYFGSSCSACQS